MFQSNIWSLIVVLYLHLNKISGLSYNQPKFCSNATWNPNATTFENNTILSSNSTINSLYIDTINTVYVAHLGNNRILIWFEGSINFTRLISGDLISPHSLFVTVTGDIYIDNGSSRRRVDKWIANATNSTPAMYVSMPCYGLFVDVKNSLYCSIQSLHQVARQSLDNLLETPTVIAGTGCSGLTSNKLTYPSGIFIDGQFSLYVADSGNNRIQLFRTGFSQGETVIGNGSSLNISLNWPTGIVLDDNNHLCIVDQNNNRIIGSSPNGFQCLVGSSQLQKPFSLSFDSYGNMFVLDTGNNRIPKFLLSANSCDESVTYQTTISTIVSTVSTIPTMTLNSNLTNVSYNLPKFCSNATWNPNATTFANISLVGWAVRGIFIDINNTVYVASQANNRITIWCEGTADPVRYLSINANVTNSLFVTLNGDSYAYTSGSQRQVSVWKANPTNSTPVLYNIGSCYGLFVDLNDNLYCSISAHQVFMKSNHDSPNISNVVAGTGRPGVASNMLNNPRGIFVDTNFDLYVADAGNHRIQRFPAGQLIGRTVAGVGIPASLTLYSPSGIVVDNDGNLFIVEEFGGRITMLGQNGFRCLVGCSGSTGSKPDQFNGPFTLSFDSHGNMFVSDSYNGRIQKFLLVTNSCSSSTIAFTSSSCSIQNKIGTGCNTRADPCTMMKPCFNNGTCTNTNLKYLGYQCSCPIGFNGSNCENDIRLCKPTTCWNNGVCSVTSNSTFACSCQPGWTGIYCEKKINFCENVNCLNNGVCRPLLLNFTCECLGTSYSGRYCEITSTKTLVHKIVSKSFGYIAILFLLGIVSFFVIMDILKYGFGIDPTKDELERIRSSTIYLCRSTSNTKDYR